jgi:hypothetical protein
MQVREAATLISHRVDDYRPALPPVELRLLRRPRYQEAARQHPPIAEQISLGLLDEDADVRLPVFATLETRVITACPEIVVDNLANEPARLHRPYVDGAVLRELLLFFAEEGWQGRAQVRAVMARHFPLQLVAAEAVDGTGYQFE